MADDKGELHTSEEFNKAKRYLLWSCSLAILLWMVHVENGSVDSPMLGTSAKIGVHWLRGAIWLSCVYFLIGFFRQVRSVERVNSQMLYAKELAGMRQRLKDVAAQFNALGDAAQTVGMKLLTHHGWLPDSMTVHAALAKVVDDHADAIDRVGRAEDGGAPLKVSPVQLSILKQNLKSSLKVTLNSMFVEFGDRCAEAGGDNEDVELISLVRKARTDSQALNSLGSSFYNFSEDIVSEQLTMFKWYDKYLGYAMFALASIASAWPLIVNVAAAMPQPISPQLSTVILSTVTFLLGSALLFIRTRSRRYPYGPEHYFRIGRWHVSWQYGPETPRSSKRRRTPRRKRGSS